MHVEGLTAKRIVFTDKGAELRPGREFSCPIQRNDRVNDLSRGAPTSGPPSLMFPPVRCFKTVTHVASRHPEA
jgi:hypothetical protein